MSNTQQLIVTFKAYQNTDRDLLVNRLVGIDGWSHIGQVRASSELNHIEVDVFFSKDGKRVRDSIRRETLFGAWKVQAFA